MFHKRVAGFVLQRSRLAQSKKTTHARSKKFRGEFKFAMIIFHHIDRQKKRCFHKGKFVNFFVASFSRHSRERSTVCSEKYCNQWMFKLLLAKSWIYNQESKRKLMNIHLTLFPDGFRRIISQKFIQKLFCNQSKILLQDVNTFSAAYCTHRVMKHFEKSTHFAFNLKNSRLVSPLLQQCVICPETKFSTE